MLAASFPGIQCVKCNSTCERLRTPQDNNSHLLKDSESERPIFESAGIPFVLLIDPPSEVVLHREAEESPLQGWPTTLSLRPSFCLLVFELLLCLLGQVEIWQNGHSTLVPMVDNPN